MLGGIHDVMQKFIEQLVAEQEAWIRAVLLSELGPDFYGQHDKIIALEANKRGYKLAHNGNKIEIRDTHDNIVSSFVVNARLEHGEGNSWTLRA